MVHCADSRRLWAGCLEAANRYKDSLDKQISLIAQKDLEFVQLEREIKAARRHFGVAKTAVINHHRLHRCDGQESRSAT
jgi:hypothetical protein